MSGNGGECKIIQEILDNIKQLIDQYNKELCNYNSDISNKLGSLWYNFNQFFSEKDLFSKDYSIPTITKTAKTRFSFVGLKHDCESLSLPIVSFDNNEFNFQPDKLEFNFGSFCPSLYRDPIKFNLLSFIKDDIEIKSDTNEVTCYNDQNNSLIILSINIPLSEKDDNDIQEKIISGKIHFKLGKTDKEKDFQFEFRFTLVPCKIFITNSKYPLVYNTQTNEYQLKTSQLMTGEEIRFDIKYYNLFNCVRF